MGFMHLDLTDEETAVLVRELTDITFTARYQLSPRIKTLNAILAKLSEPSTPPKRCEPLSKGRYRRR
jgi:hypothetical protein